MISVEKNLDVKQMQTCMIVQSSDSNFPAKSPVLQRQHLLVVSVTVAVAIALVISGKNGKIGTFFSLKCSSSQCKTDCLSVQYAQKVTMKSFIFTDHYSAKLTPKMSVNFLQNQPYFP